MTIQLNGEQHSLELPCSLETLIASLGLIGKRYAIEVNQSVIPKSEHAEFQLQANDVVEIVQAIGGG